MDFHDLFGHKVLFVCIYILSYLRERKRRELEKQEKLRRQREELQTRKYGKKNGSHDRLILTRFAFMQELLQLLNYSSSSTILKKKYANRLPTRLPGYVIATI